MDLKRYLPVVILSFSVVFIQVLTAIFKVPFYLTQLTMSAYYVMVAAGLCMLLGYAGQISLGQAGFFAIGGYTSATLTTINLINAADSGFVLFLDKLGLLIADQNIYGEHILYLSPWIASLLAIGLAIAVAFLIGRPVLKLRGHYLAMATMGFGIIIYRIVLGTRLFGEADGISNVPAFGLLPGLSVSGNFAARISNYYIAWGAVTIGMLVLVNLINSRVGRGLRSLHGGAEAAESIGINTSRYKLNVFVMAAVYSAVAGVLMTHYNGGIGPGEVHLIKSVRYVSIVAIGGMANIWGTLIMGTVLNFLSLRGIFGSYDDAVFGSVLVMIILFAPDGFLGLKILPQVGNAVKGIMRSAFQRGAEDE